MKQKLTQYVDLLFAGAPHAEDMKQEILQNTLDRYDDLIAQGKAPEAAYQLAISGIGDINELLTGTLRSEPSYSTHTGPESAPDLKEKRLRKSVAIAMYILCPVPLFILSEFGLATLGLCLMLALVAAATVLLIMNGNSQDEEKSQNSSNESKNPLNKSIDTLISVIGTIAYFLVSFATRAWYITWVIFPLIGAVKGLVKAILDLKEVEDYAQ